MVPNLWKEKLIVWAPFKEIPEEFLFQRGYTIRILHHTDPWHFYVLTSEWCLTAKEYGHVVPHKLFIYNWGSMWREKNLDNFSHNSTWVHAKVQKGEGGVSGNRDCSLPLSVFICLTALASKAAARSMPKKWPHELKIKQTFRISLA